MAEIKTKANQLSVSEYLSKFDHQKKHDADTLINIFKELTGENPVMWGTSIIGFGNKRYTYESGRQIDYFLIGFALRKKAITIYLMIDLQNKILDYIGKLDKGVGCLYIKSLEEINIEAFRDLCQQSIEEARKRK
ncbi:MAG: DUF1801 domain-containing protein [Tenericutes bacterium]|nr:DUF1801 domain-containing protein [Mycoplasmatota bacterium]